MATYYVRSGSGDEVVIHAVNSIIAARRGANILETSDVIVYDRERQEIGRYVDMLD